MVEGCGCVRVCVREDVGGYLLILLLYPRVHTTIRIRNIRHPTHTNHTQITQYTHTHTHTQTSQHKNMQAANNNDNKIHTVRQWYQTSAYNASKSREEMMKEGKMFEKEPGVCVLCGCVCLRTSKQSTEFLSISYCGRIELEWRRRMSIGSCLLTCV